MDDMDQVQPNIDAFQAFALDQQQRHREPDNNNGTACIDCYEEIPLKRRLAKPGCRRCITCQETFEMEATE
jgi:phage/conjugal plasmid C-4 type zinc finger TraR family protein